MKNLLFCVIFCLFVSSFASILDSYPLEHVLKVKSVIDSHYKSKLPNSINNDDCFFIAKNGMKNFIPEHAPVNPKTVGVIGAGIAGLSAAYVLTNEYQNFEVTIFEAQNRAGGRIFTDTQSFSDGLYAEIGAMRIPDHHLCVLEWVKYFNLTVQPFVNENPNGYIYFDYQRFRQSQVDANPDLMGFNVSKTEQGKTAEDLLEAALNPLITVLLNSSNPERAWDLLAQQYDSYSVYSFFRQQVGFSEGAIEMISLMDNLEGTISTSVLELLRDYFTLGLTTRTYFTIPGGMHQFPDAFAASLSDNIYYNTEAFHFIQEQNGTVTVRVANTITAVIQEFNFDYIIITAPFSVVSHWKFEPPLSRPKQRAIRELHYDSSTKIYLQFKHKFWEDAGIIGGRSITSLPSRFMYYPIVGEGIERGIMLASYTWGNDARKWLFMNEDEAIANCLVDVAQVHGLDPNLIFDIFEAGLVWNWDTFPYSGGAFALFDPGQLSFVYPELISPEWNSTVFFAGEHISSDHAWILGSIESAMQVVVEIVKHASK